MCCTRLAGNTVCKNDATNRHLRTIAQLSRAVSLQLRHVSKIGKNLLNSNTSSTCFHNMANFSPLTAEIGSFFGGTPANISRFRFLASLLHGTLVVGISKTLQRWTEGASYIYSAGWPLRWALAHILVLLYFYANTVNAHPNLSTCTICAVQLVFCHVISCGIFLCCIESDAACCMAPCTT